jgi:hypothetical protein
MRSDNYNNEKQLFFSNIIFDSLRRVDPVKYPLVFHDSNDRAILWNGALDLALYEELGYDIDEPNEEEGLNYPAVLPLRGNMGRPTIAVDIIQEGENEYVVFPSTGYDLNKLKVTYRELTKDDFK